MSAQLTPLVVRDLPDRLFIDLAIGAAPFEGICHTYNIEPDALGEFDGDPEFRQRLLIAKQAVEDDGRAFRARCRTVVHDSVPRLKAIIYDPEVPASSQIEAFKSLVKYAGLEPAPQGTGQTAGVALSLTIIAPGGERQEINITPTQTTSPTHEPLDLEWVEA